MALTPPSPPAAPRPQRYLRLQALFTGVTYTPLSKKANGLVVGEENCNLKIEFEIQHLISGLATGLIFPTYLSRYTDRHLSFYYMRIYGHFHDFSSHAQRESAPEHSNISTYFKTESDAREKGISPWHFGDNKVYDSRIEFGGRLLRYLGSCR